MAWSIETGADPGATQFQVQAVAMGVGYQDALPALVAQRFQECHGPGAFGDQVLNFAFQGNDVEFELGGPVIGAIPVQAVLFALEALMQGAAAGLGFDLVQLRETLGQMVLPEVVVEVEVEQGAVHIEENGVDGAPRDHPT